MKKTKESIIKRIFEIRDIIDFIDDGYHNEVIFYLIKISNELFYKLDPEEQKMLQKWYDEKFE